MRLWGVAGYKNAGKTGLVERLVRELTSRGLTVSTLKHAHHSFDLDQHGRDSHRHRVAGAHQVLIASDERWALMTEARQAPDLADLLARLDPVDVVILEGWKAGDHHKIEAHRAEAGHALIAPGDPHVQVVATDVPDTVRDQVDVPVIALDDTAALADFILAAP